MNELTSFIVDSVLNEEIKDVVVIYGGRFQPFHNGHYAIYSHLVKKFGKNNVFIGTSDKVSKPDSPFNFKEKKEIMTRMFNIPSSQIEKLKSPYTPTEILKKYDEDTTGVVFAVGHKDKSRLGGNYYTPFKSVDQIVNGYRQKGYVYNTPNLSKLSGTEVRKNLSSGTEEERKEYFSKVAFPKFDKKIFNLVSSNISESMNEEICIDVEIGDTILTGRFKNKKTVVKTIGVDDHGMPTINGRKVVTFRKQKPEKEQQNESYYVDFADDPIVVPKEIVEAWMVDRMNLLLNEVTINLGFVTAGDLKKKSPSAFISNDNVYHTVHKDRAQKIGYQLVKHILDKNMDDFVEYDVDLETNNPSESFIEDVVGRLTGVGENDFETRKEYHEWFQSVLNAMALAGYNIIHYKDEYMRTIDGDMEYSTRGLGNELDGRVDTPKPYKDEVDDTLEESKVKEKTKPIHISKETIHEWVKERFPQFIQEISVSGVYSDNKDPDDGPNAFFPNYKTFDDISKRRAEHIGYTVIGQIMNQELEDYYEHPIYPDGPIDSVSSFPAGVIGKLTAMNQRDFETVEAYHDWFNHVTRSMALAGYELIKFKASGEPVQDEDEQLSTIGLDTLKNDKTAEIKKKIKSESKSVLTDEEIESIVNETLDEFLAMGYPSKDQYEKKLKDLKKQRTKLDNMDDDRYEHVNEQFDRVKYYEEHFKNLSPTKTKVVREGKSIRIEFNDESINERTDIKRINKSLGIPRHEMPQIESKNVNDFVKFLKGNGVRVKSKKIPVRSVKMAQREINGDKVRDLMGAEISNLNKPVIISNDNYILDGHHRVVAILNLDDSYRLDTVFIDLPIEELLKMTKEYPKVFYKSVSETVLQESKLLGESNLKLNVPRDIRDIHKLFKKNRKKLFIVGGAVRDAILGKRPKDFDLATDATPDEVLKIAEKGNFSTVEVGKSFGVVVVGGHEIATFRKDIGKGRRPDSVEYTDIEGDVRRRDLTINALFYDLDRNEIVDLVGGIEDLKSKKVRTVGDPKQRFEEDPLRKMRALRFAGQMGGRIDSETEEALNSDPSLDGVSPERVRDEFIKGIQKSKKTSQYLILADDLGMLENILPNVTLVKPYIDESNYQVLLGYLFQNINPTKLDKYLNKLKYTIEDIRNIKFLVRLTDFDPRTELVDMKRQHEHVSLTDNDIIRFGKYVRKDFNKFLNFDLSISGKELVDLGFRGREIGDELQKREYQKYINESLNEAPMEMNKGFQFVAKKDFQDIKRGVKYVVSNIKGKIGDLRVVVTRLGTRGGKTDRKIIKVRSVPEFYMNVLGENITEGNSPTKYSYGCLMLKTPFKNWENLTSMIDEEDVFYGEDGSFGIEDEPHITVLYGLHEGIESEDLKSLVSDVENVDYKITGVSIFENENFDVVKLDIESDTLHELNERCKSLPHTSTYPDYHPHMTISYVKPGMGKKYVREFENPIELSSNTFKYSNSNGNKTYF